MSSKNYQNQWIQHILNPDQKLSDTHFLSKNEYEYLKDWHSDTQQSSRILEKVEAQLISQIPLSLNNLLSKKFLRLCIQRFLKENQPTELLLHFISQQQINTKTSEFKHFSDICRYEMVLKDLTFYEQPKPLPYYKGPILATWARVIYLGSYFKLVFETLLKNQSTAELPDSPQQPYLLLQEFKGTQLIKLEPLLAKCLEKCTGKIPWKDIVEKILQENTDKALSARDNLLRSETHFLNEGILLSSSVSHSEPEATPEKL